MFPSIFVVPTFLMGRFENGDGVGVWGGGG